MDHIWSNPSFQRSIIKNRAIVSEMINCLKITIPMENEAVKQVIVMPNKEYVVKFYSDDYGELLLKTGMVCDVYPDQIKMKFINNDRCTQTVATTGNKCVLVQDPELISKYEDNQIMFIPIENIIDIGYNISKEV